MLTLHALNGDHLSALIANPAAALASYSNRDEIAGTVVDVAKATRALYERTGTRSPWIGYLAERQSDGSIVGTCGFTSPPSAGNVEVTFFTFSRYENQGNASAMLRHLILIALSDVMVDRILAHTLPEENASAHILRKAGFIQEGMDEDDEAGHVWRWSLSTDSPASA